MRKFAKNPIISRIWYPIINYIWYLEYELINDNIIHIISHLGIYRESFEYPQTKDQFRLEEDSDRNVIGAIINGVEFKVDNPKYVFDYNKTVKTQGNERNIR